MAGLLNKKSLYLLSKWNKLFFHKNIENNEINKIIISLLDYYKNNDLVEDLMNKKFILLNDLKLKNFNLTNILLNIHAVVLVYINGIFNNTLSSQNYYPLKIKVFKSNKKNFFFKKISLDDFFFRFTKNSKQEKTKIYVPENIGKINIYILNINYGSNNLAELNHIFSDQHLYIGKNSEIDLLEHHVSLNKNKYLNGTNLYINVGENSTINHIKIFNENSKSYHFSSDKIELSKNNFCKSNIFMLGNYINNYNINSIINGEYSKFLLNVLSLSEKKENFIIKSYTEHKKSFCNSYQIHKTITNNNATTNFLGNIKILKNSIQTNAQLINNNLLIGEFSRVFTNPNLEIYDDDVKCSHGATVGKIDKNQVFYLQSRGIKKKIAKKIIIYAFLSVLVEDIDNKILRKFIFKKINLKLQRIK